MISADRYRYHADVYADGPDPVQTIALTPDWVPLSECGYFQGIREGSVPPLNTSPPAKVEPLWDPSLGAPYVGELRVSFSGTDGFHTDVSYQCLDESVRTQVAELVRAGQLPAGRDYTYRVCAFRAGDTPPDPATVEVTAVPASFDLTQASIQALSCESARYGSGAWSDGDFPVFLEPTVLREIRAQADDAGEFETGGLLIGQLHRDSGSSEVFLRISAQIPARHTVAARTSLKFTAETWTAAAAAMKLRGRNEMICGWHHSHPWFCRRCPPERQRVCELSRAPFFSADDRGVHRTVFPQAYQVALLVSYLGAKSTSIDCFGWRQGRIRARGFTVPAESAM